MSFATLADYAFDFYRSYPFVVAAIAIVLLFIAYRRPKESFKFALLLLVMAAVFYALGLLRDTLSTGLQNTNEGIQKSKNLDD
jgi:multisubunit Na+/H+ antiporter MnhB subunit